MLSLQRERQEAVAQAGVHTLTCALTLFFVFVYTCMLLFVHLNMDVFECVYASAFVSVCPYHFA